MVQFSYFENYEFLTKIKNRKSMGCIKRQVMIMPPLL